MKKFVLSLMLMFIGCIYAVAGDNVRLVSGSTAILKDSGVKAEIVYDWAGATWDNHQPLKEHFESEIEYNNLVENFEEMYFSFFNQKSKGLKLTHDQEPIKMVVKIKAFDHAWQGFSGMEATFYGTISIIDSSEDKTLCEIKVHDLEGGTTIKGVDEAYKRLIEKLAKKISGLKK